MRTRIKIKTLYYLTKFNIHCKHIHTLLPKAFPVFEEINIKHYSLDCYKYLREGQIYYKSKQEKFILKSVKN